MDDVNLPTFRRGVLPGVCTLLLAACGGDADDPAPQAAAPKANSAVAPAPAAAAPAAAAQPARDSTAPAAAAPSGSATIAEQMLEAPVSGPVNVQVLEGYELSMDRIRQLVQAGRNLRELQQRRPELRDSMRLEAFDPNAMYERMNAIPEVREAIARVGMTPREYATATAALTQAATVAALIQRGRTPAVEYNERNVQFVIEHWQEIQQITSSAAQPQHPES